MNINSDKIVAVTGHDDIVEILDVPARFTYDALIANELTMLNVVCYNIPVTLLIKPDGTELRFLSGSTIIDVDELDTPIGELLPKDLSVGHVILDVCALLMTIREMKKQEAL